MKRSTGARLCRSLAWAFGFTLLAAAALEVSFATRVALMRFANPTSTTFERSELVRIWQLQGKIRWRQQWLDYGQISDHLKRAVIASEDAGFVDHSGVEWDAIEKAWQRNEAALAKSVTNQAIKGKPTKQPKVVGGSTISQQLAKNLFLSGERNLLRKLQELLLTMTLEVMLPKERILEIYLNNVEWGEGIFGADAAARHYFKKAASTLTPYEAARLAVMLPAPKRFEKLQGSGFLANRAQTIVARMGDVELP